jgi:hypothetical protein
VADSAEAAAASGAAAATAVAAAATAAVAAADADLRMIWLLVAVGAVAGPTASGGQVDTINAMAATCRPLANIPFLLKKQRKIMI